MNFLITLAILIVLTLVYSRVQALRRVTREEREKREELIKQREWNTRL